MLCRRCRSSIRAQLKSLGTLNHGRNFTSSSRAKSYADTIANLKIGADTRVIFQGFTGRQATANARESLEYGTKIVGGVTPKKEGEHLGLPVLPTVRRAMEELKPDATGIYVAAHQAPAAIEEAIEAEVPLIVAVAEHIPLHSMLRIHQILSTQSKSRLVGANAPGIISAIGKCRIGFQPLSTYSPGHVGIIAKSGTLSYETVASLTRSGVGQSLCIGMGGDPIAGTDFVDGLKMFENDTDTHAIVLVGEVGGTAEEEAAAWIKDYTARVKDPKPIAALVGGICAKPGKIMGHAGAWAAPGEGSALTKWKTLEDAGVTMVDHPEKFGPVLKGILSKKGSPILASSSSAGSQQRGYHTMLRRPHLSQARSSGTSAKIQYRPLHLRADQSADLLKEYDVSISDPPQDESDSRLLVITINRTARSPAIIVSPTTNPNAIYYRTKHIPYDYVAGPKSEQITQAVQHLQLSSAPSTVQASLSRLIQNLSRLFKDKEAVALEVRLAISDSSQTLQAYSPNFSFDDAAFKSTQRQQDLHQLRDTSLENATELAAEPDGIVYVRLDSTNKDTETTPRRNIGTLVNGAGLAMNTVDALESYGGYATNFLDTGGKATSETVKKSFELILSDPRVDVVFVNIFGGLTLGDMIARGVILAFKELDVRKPVVVRIRGTNEKEGQKLIADSGLALFAYETFEDAAKKVVELANGARGQ